MNPLDYFSADTTGAVSSPESRQEDAERAREYWRRQVEKWDRACGIRQDPPWLTWIMAKLGIGA